MASTTATPTAAKPTPSAPNSTSSIAPVERIGSTAGDIWHFLNNNGPQSMTKVINAVDAPRETVLQALGWLAREGKIDIGDDSRNRVVSLKQ